MPVAAQGSGRSAESGSVAFEEFLSSITGDLQQETGSTRQEGEVQNAEDRAASLFLIIVTPEIFKEEGGYPSLPANPETVGSGYSQPLVSEKGGAEHYPAKWIMSVKPAAADSFRIEEALPMEDGEVLARTFTDIEPKIGDLQQHLKADSTLKEGLGNSRPIHGVPAPSIQSVNLNPGIEAEETAPLVNVSPAPLTKADGNEKPQAEPPRLDKEGDAGVQRAEGDGMTEEPEGSGDRDFSAPISVRREGDRPSAMEDEGTGPRLQAGQFPEGHNPLHGMPKDTPLLHQAEGNSPARDAEGIHRPLDARPLLNDEQRFVVTKFDGRSIELTLEPEGIGKIEIEMAVERGVVSAQISAADPAAKDLIERHLHLILEALDREGLDIGGFSISLKDRKGQGKEGGEELKDSRDDRENGPAPARERETLISIIV